MYKDILITVLKVSWPILLICAIAYVITFYATRPRGEDGKAYIRFRTVKVYKKKKRLNKVS